MARFPPMDEGPRFFTIEEANALVGALQIEFGRVARARAGLGPLIAALGGPDAATALLSEGADLPPGREAEVLRLRELAGEITSAVERINGMGCLVKDLEQGLVDFYGLQDGEPIFFCWQFGEPAVTFWHGVDEGFAGRRPVDGLEVPRPELPN